MLSFLIFALISDTAAIHTTVADSSRVAFIAQTPLTWETVEHHNQDYIKFTDSPLMDSIGYPELPMITCLVAFPDNVTPELEFTFSDVREVTVDPVYPAPAMIISTEFTPSVVDSFVQDSTAYSSGDFWPAERVRIIGETTICRQRLLKVQMFPAQYRASDSTLSIVSNFSVSLAFDSATAVWNTTGLGAFQRLIGDSPVVGYHQAEPTTVTSPTYFGEVDPEDGPSRMPDYVIICASGLYDQCYEAIDDLAEHRVSLNGFDVALVTTDEIMDDFGGTNPYLSPPIIRDFTEHMWESWTQTSGKKPSYLLLIGDHEDHSYFDEPWFFPTHEYDGLYPADSPPMQFEIGNDEWYAYFNDDRSINSDFPDMMVGRLSVKNGGALQPDTLSALIYNLIDLEDPIQQAPLVDYRRRILRLAGAGSDFGDTALQHYGYSNTPGRLWTGGFSDWLGYDYTTWYCGDGRDFTYDDLSLMKSREWVSHCLTELGRGAGVAFYTNHGSTHLFSAGLEWWPKYIEDDDFTKGARDSTFNNYQIEQNLTASQYHSPPFMLLLCCSSGNYNHTQSEHDEPVCWPELCSYEGYLTPPVHYDFGTDCIAEKLLKHTDVPVAGVFCGSQSSFMGSYARYGKGILEAIYSRGHGRLGDAIQSARLQYEDYFLGSSGSYRQEMGQFNLLGDPALDISDRVRYPNDCDLLVFAGDVDISEYPIEGATSTTLPLSFTIRNNGAQNSASSFNTEITLRNGSNSTVIDVNCGEIIAGDSIEVTATWICPAWFVPPMEIDVTIVVDSDEDCSDSWRGNNSCVQTIQLNDTYPVDSEWLVDNRPLAAPGVINSTPLLVNLDTDTELEVVVLAGSTLSAYEDDGTLIWQLSSEGFCDGNPLAVDLTGDGKSELILASSAGIKVINPDGTWQQTLSIVSSVFTVGDMRAPTTDLELCIADGEDLHLYKWDDSIDKFVEEETKRFSSLIGRDEGSICCADLGESSYEDVVYCTTGLNSPTPYADLTVYDWENSELLIYKTWSRAVYNVYPAVGELAGTKLVGLPFGAYTERTQFPAVLVEPDGTFEADCAKSEYDAKEIRYGVYADWDPFVSGPDAFILPSERQCFAWDIDGDAVAGFATAEYQGASLGSQISPTALGDLNNSGESNVLFCTLLSGVTNLLAFDSGGDLLTALGFPIALPDGVVALKGFAIADIDRDDNIEIVFGTSDGKLHCWELGSCATGYAPWPQFQHDYGRTGVLD
ncbi:MAG: hypothetical protein KAS73_15155 [Candidatus Sabulitectum sp.]|nr:hypothetical protein [Candidatus Sabulitectum sp.]